MKRFFLIMSAVFFCGVLFLSGCADTSSFPTIREYSPSQKSVLQQQYSLSLNQLEREPIIAERDWQNLYIQGSQVCDMLALQGAQSVRQQVVENAKQSTVFFDETAVLEEVDAFIRALTYPGSFCPGVGR